MESPNQQPNQQPNTVYVVAKSQKSTLAAFLLALFFGPLGLLYASITGGIIMIIVTIAVAIFTFGIGLIFTQIVCVIWALVAVNSSKN